MPYPLSPEGGGILPPGVGLLALTLCRTPYLPKGEVSYKRKSEQNGVFLRKHRHHPRCSFPRRRRHGRINPGQNPESEWESSDEKKSVFLRKKHLFFSDINVRCYLVYILPF